MTKIKKYRLERDTPTPGFNPGPREFKIIELPEDMTPPPGAEEAPANATVSDWKPVKEPKEEK